MSSTDNERVLNQLDPVSFEDIFAEILLSIWVRGDELSLKFSDYYQPVVRQYSIRL
jgi:hypothetical protein